MVKSLLFISLLLGGICHARATEVGQFTRSVVDALYSASQIKHFNANDITMDEAMNHFESFIENLSHSRTQVRTFLSHSNEDIQKCAESFEESFLELMTDYRRGQQLMRRIFTERDNQDNEEMIMALLELQTWKQDVQKHWTQVLMSARLSHIALIDKGNDPIGHLVITSDEKQNLIQHIDGLFPNATEGSVYDKKKTVVAAASIREILTGIPIQK